MGSRIFEKERVRVKFQVGPVDTEFLPGIYLLVTSKTDVLGLQTGIT